MTLSDIENHESEIAGFVAKTFEILNVFLFLFRMKNLAKSFSGGLMVRTLSSRMLTSLRK